MVAFTEPVDGLQCVAEVFALKTVVSNDDAGLTHINCVHIVEEGRASLFKALKQLICIGNTLLDAFADLGAERVVIFTIEKLMLL